MAKYRVLRNIAPFPFDGAATDLVKGTVFELDERDPDARRYIEALMESPGAIEKIGAKPVDESPKKANE